MQSWDPTLVNPCTWFHITCNSENSVTRVDLGNANLSGQLVTQLGQLPNLQYLSEHLSFIARKFPSHLQVHQPSFMSDLDIQIPNAFDPFVEATAEDSSAGSKEYVHIRIQQRNGRKSLTTVQGLKKEFSYNKILKDLKEFCCNGTVVENPELGQVSIDSVLHVDLLVMLFLVT